MDPRPTWLIREDIESTERGGMVMIAHAIIAVVAAIGVALLWLWAA